jgi:DNA-directed RNA polymerase specialized sigma subunit
VEECGYEIVDELHNTPMEIIIEAERKAAVVRAITLLNEESQQILTLFSKGYTDAEIGESLGLKRSTVQYRKAMLIENLRKKLKNF